MAKTKLRPRPLLSTQDAIAAIIKAACNFHDQGWDNDDPTDAIAALDDAVEDYRRSQREYLPNVQKTDSIDDLRAR